MSLKHDDAAAQERQQPQAPRVSLADIEAQVEARFLVNGAELANLIEAGSYKAIEALKGLTIAVVVLKNGFSVIGTSAPASSANYDKALGEKFAYENALRQLWPLMGYELRARLYAQEGNLPETPEAAE